MDDMISIQDAINEIMCQPPEPHYPSWYAEQIKKLPIKHLPKGEWLRFSNLSEKDDNRYICSHCGNVVRHNSRMDLYTFNSWCGKCGSDNRRRE